MLPPFEPVLCGGAVFLRIMTKSKQQNTNWDSATEQIFLNMLRETGNVSASAAAAGVERSFVYRKRQTAARFQKHWQAAMEEALDNLEDHLWGKAMGMKEAGQKSQVDERIAILLLKAHRPEIFGDGKTRKRADEKSRTASPRAKLLGKLEQMSGRTKS